MRADFSFARVGRVVAVAGAFLLGDVATADETGGLSGAAPAARIALPSPLALAFEQEREKAASQEPRPVPQRPAVTPGWHVFFEGGASTYHLSGDLPGKFQEHRDVPRGFFLRFLDLDLIDKESPWSAYLHALDVRERDQRIATEVSRIGRLRTTFLWDEIPTFFSNSPTLEQETAPGVLQVSPSIRAGLQSLVDGQPPQNIPPAFFDFVRRELAVAPKLDVGFRRETGLFRQSVSPTDDWEFHVQAQHIHRTGTRPLATGTFARQANGPAGDGTWEALGIELPAPVDDRTENLNAGARVSGRHWQVGLDFDYDLYRDQIPSITYDNPFRVTDAIATTPGGNVGRERFVRAQLAAAPDNDFYRVTLRGGWEFARESQIRGVFAWAESKQNDPFLPFTLNTALTAPGLDLTSTSSLPARSLDGKIRSIDQEYAVVSRALQAMTFRLEYRSEDQDNESPSYVFPGVSRFGDSYFLTAVDYYNIPIRNLPTSYLRQDGTASWRWDVVPAFTTTLEYRWEAWNRTFRDVHRTEENTGRVKLDFTPSTAVTIRADYQYGKRNPDLYKTVPFTYVVATNSWVVTPATVFDPTVPLEFNLLRRYDETARRQHDGKVWADFRMGPSLTLSATLRYLRDDYADGFYGLTFDESRVATGELHWSPGERGYVYATYTWQQDRMEYLGLGHLIPGAVPGVTACCAVYPVANTWDRSSHSTLNSLEVGFNYATDGERWTFDGSYALSDARDIIHTFNPYPILANSSYTAGAYNYPDTTDRFQEVRVGVAYRIRKGLDVGIRYLYEPYRSNDFSLNNMQPYSQGAIFSGGVPVNVQRYILLNSRYGNYTSNQIAAFLKYRY
jgi:MtrB/PioB family decaheme-associated outer membrane protein